MAGYTEAFLAASTGFKDVADEVSCLDPVSDGGIGRCHDAMQAKSDIRSHPVWKEGKGRIKAGSPAKQKISKHAGISEDPVPAGPCFTYEGDETHTEPLTKKTVPCAAGVAKWLSYPSAEDFFSQEFVHAKGLFSRNPETKVAQAFDECDAPFVAGPSGTMWTVLALLSSSARVRARLPPLC